MTWLANQQVEVGYAIPALFVSGPMNMEKLTTPKPQVFGVVSFGTNQDRHSVSSLQERFGATYADFSRLSLLGELEYNNNASIGVVGGNSDYLNYTVDVLPETDSESVVVKEPLRVSANQIQLVMFNDFDQFISIESYELVIGSAGISRMETES